MPVPPIGPNQTAPPIAHIPLHQAIAPLGISSQPSTLSEPTEGSCLGTIGNFFCSIYVTVLKTFGDFIHFLLSFAQDEPSDTIDLPSDDWMLPAQIPVATCIVAPPVIPAQAAQIAIPNPADAPAEPALPPNPVVAEQPPQPLPPPDPFSLLRLIPHEMRKIYRIVHTLGTTTTFGLLRHQTTLAQLGREIDHVHPLKFLEYILSHNILRGDLNAIRNNGWVWPRFLEGLSNKLVRENARLPAQLPGFAQAMQVDLAQLTPFLQSKNWEEMVSLLLRLPMPMQVAPIPIQPPAPPPVQAEPIAQPPVMPVQAEPIDPPMPVEVEPPVLTPWEQVALADEHKTMLAEVVRAHRELGYFRAGAWGDRHIGSLWDRLDRANPLAILAHLFTNQELAAELNSLSPYRLHWRYFIAELTALLEHKTREDYLPYTTDFSQVVQSDETTIISHIHLRKWGDLIEMLREPV